MADLDRKVYTIKLTGPDDQGVLTGHCPLCSVTRRHADQDKCAGMVNAHMIGQHNVAATTRHRITRK